MFLVERSFSIVRGDKFDVTIGNWVRPEGRRPDRHAQQEMGSSV